MKLLIVHDWLVGMRGGERCLEELCGLYPGADILTLFYSPDDVTDVIRSHRVEASVLNSLPGVHRYYRYFLPIYSAGVADLSRRLKRLHEQNQYDAVVSISHCVAKNVVVPEGVPHLCYCLTPVRYLWDQYDAYFRGRRSEPVVRRVAPLLRKWDLAGARRVDAFVAISDFVADRIRRFYQRDATVVYPPVRTAWITPCEQGERGDGFLSVSALVPYKNVDLIVTAFTRNRLPLTLVGTGPERERLRKLAGQNIVFRDRVSDDELAELYRRSKALVFAAVEDFGMAPVESLASGRPVIALAKGGVLETVVFAGKQPTGVPFGEPTPTSLTHAVYSFLDREREFSVEICKRQAANFTREIFRKRFAEELNELLVRKGKVPGKPRTAELNPEVRLLAGAGRD